MAEPTLIYMSIGCANNGEQQCPDFVRQWDAKHKICILIDPFLETPLSCEPLLDSSIVVLRYSCEFDTIETMYEYATQGQQDVARNGSQFIHDLCDLVLRAPLTHLIVQEYTGRESENYYPVQTFGPALLKRALFGITYGESGCFIDFRKVHILRDEAGDFVQPRFLPLLMTVNIPHYAKERLYEDITDRMNAVRLYIHRLYRIQTGREEPRDWCTHKVVKRHMRRLSSIYGVALAMDPDTLLRLSGLVLSDLCSAARVALSECEHTELLNDIDGRQLGSAMVMMRDLLMDEPGPGAVPVAVAPG